MFQALNSQKHALIWKNKKKFDWYLQPMEMITLIVKSSIFQEDLLKYYISRYITLKMIGSLIKNHMIVGNLLFHI
jgi:hypothetical protein